MMRVWIKENMDLGSKQVTFSLPLSTTIYIPLKGKELFNI